MQDLALSLEGSGAELMPPLGKGGEGTLTKPKYLVVFINISVCIYFTEQRKHNSKDPMSSLSVSEWILETFISVVFPFSLLS